MDTKLAQIAPISRIQLFAAVIFILSSGMTVKTQLSITSIRLWCIKKILFGSFSNSPQHRFGATHKPNIPTVLKEVRNTNG
jgi:hypothetical protein